MMRQPAEALPVRAHSEPLARPVSLAVPRSIALPIEVRIIILALCFRVLASAAGFIANVAIPDYQNQGFTVMERAESVLGSLRPLGLGLVLRHRL